MSIKLTYDSIKLITMSNESRNSRHLSLKIFENIFLTMFTI